MGRKAKSAGTTKHRERTCDKLQRRNKDVTYVDGGGHFSRSARRKAKKKCNDKNEDQYNLFLHYVYEGNYQEAYNVYTKNSDFGHFEHQSCGKNFKELLEELDKMKYK